MRVLNRVVLFEIVLASLISAVYFQSLNVAGSALAWLFAPLMVLGQMSCLSLLVFAPLYLLAMIWPRLNLLCVLAVMVGSLFQLLLIIDVGVYQQYRFHIDGSILNLLLGGAAGQIFVMSAQVYLKGLALLLLMIAAQAALVFGLRRRELRLEQASSGLPDRSRGLPRFVVASLFSATLASNLLHAWADASGYSPVVRQAVLMPAYYPLRARSFMARYGIEVQRMPEAESASGDFYYPQHPMLCSVDARPPNIVMILMDSWRFDELSEQVTPNIAAFTEQSLRFKQHFSGGSATRTGIFSLMYGLPGTAWHAALRATTPPVLISTLLEQNYRMGIFASAPLVSPEFDRTVFQGVADLRLRSEAADPIARDQEITDEMLEFLDRQDAAQPFFGWMLYDAPHAFAVADESPGPFQPSWSEVDYTRLNADMEPLPFRNLYRNAVHATDALIGQVLERLRQNALLDSSIVIISSDHGQEFNDTGANYWGHNSAFNQFQTQVPLVIHWPADLRTPAAQSVKGEIDYLTSHLDVAPSLLTHVLGCKNPWSDYTSGRDLFEPGGRDVLLLANYHNYALKTAHQTVEVRSFQSVDVLDAQGRLLLDAKPSPELIGKAMRMKRAFLLKPESHK